MLALYQLTFEPVWLRHAEVLADIIIERFSDPEQGGFFFTSNVHETLVSRTKDLFDNATPSGNSVAADVLIRLAALLGRDDLRQSAERVFMSVESLLGQYASGFGRMLAGVDFYIGPSSEIALTGDSASLVAAFRKHYLPRTVIASGKADIALLRDRPAMNGKPARLREPCL